MTRQLFELVLESKAEVVRGCCGGDHEFGQCPLDQQDADTNQPVDETEESECES